MEIAVHRFIASAVLALLISLPLRAETFKDAFPEIYPLIMDEFRDRAGQMNLLHGMVTLNEGQAQVDVPAGYYFLGPDDARFVIEKLWRNPPDATMLGLLFPAAMTPFGDKDWGVSFQFDPMGYVSDDDAEGYDYDDLLKQMQDDTTAGNPERQKQGYPEVTLLGWAEPPHYDKATRKLIWAKRLAFSDTPGETLNYNIRALGRKGVLVVNFIAAMPQMAEVQAAAPEVMAMVSFTTGNTYADFVPGVDTVAAVGIGGLIAGKVLSSTGILALALLFLKKGAFLILLPLAWVWTKFKSDRGRDKSGPEA